MSVLFIICIVKMKFINNQLGQALGDQTATNEQLKQILQLDSSFSELNKSSSLRYDVSKKYL